MPDDGSECAICGGQAGSHVLARDRRVGDLDACVECGAEAANGHHLCPSHQTETDQALRGYVELLRLYLEASVGAELDAYRQSGRLAQSRWWVADRIDDAVSRVVDELFSSYAHEALDARLLYGRRQADDRDDPRPYLNMEGSDPPEWFRERAAPILERAIREVFAVLPTEPVERDIITQATAGRESDDWGTPYEMVFGYLNANEPPLSCDAHDLAAFRYSRSGGLRFWSGWDSPDACWLRVDALPAWLRERLARVIASWGSVE